MPCWGWWSMSICARRSPDRSEGELAKAKALIVCKTALAAASRRLDLTPLIRLGRAEEAMGGRNRASIIADAYEALVAVIYNESGYAAARDFILRTLAPEIAQVSRGPRLARPEERLAGDASGRSVEVAPVYR